MSVFWGTGSYPPLQKGWQRIRRQATSRDPRTKPCVLKARAVYSEQVGWKRQEGGYKGEMQYW